MKSRNFHSWSDTSTTGAYAFLNLNVRSVRHQGIIATHSIIRKQGMEGRGDSTFVLRFKCMLLETPQSKAFRLGKYYKLSGKYSIYTLGSPAQSSVITWIF